MHAKSRCFTVNYCISNSEVNQHNTNNDLQNFMSSRAAYTVHAVPLLKHHCYRQYIVCLF